ncbi:hotdog domain-containing protein, partial [Acinetobacter baumannii]
MEHLYRRSTPETLPETIKQVTRLATVDMRVDYLAPGRGKYFIARAEVLRLGRKGCTMRMTMVNDEDKAIAAGIASYAY